MSYLNHINNTLAAWALAEIVGDCGGGTFRGDCPGGMAVWILWQDGEGIAVPRWIMADGRAGLRWITADGRSREGWVRGSTRGMQLGLAEARLATKTTTLGSATNKPL